MFRTSFLLPVAACAVTALSAGAFTVVDDFEQDRSYRLTDNMQFSREPLFAVDGTSALRLAAPRWGENPYEWPAFHMDDLTPSDWRDFGGLTLEAVNPGAVPRKLIVEFAGGEVGFKKSFELAPFSYRQLDIDFAELPENFDRTAVDHLTLFTECPMVPYELYLDRVALRSADETVAVPPAFEQAVSALAGSRLETLARQLAAVREPRARFAGNAAVNAFQRREVAALTEGLDAMRRRTDDGSLTLSERSAATAETGRLLARADRLARLLEKLPPDAAPVVVQAASAMDRVYPHDLPLPPAVDLDLRLARHDKAGIQVVVLPLADACDDVSVTVGELADAAGNKLADDCFTVGPVGFVNVGAYSRHRYGYLGWTPDPILNTLPAADVEAGAAQAFYLDCRTAADQPAGFYQGLVTVKSGDRLLAELPLSVRVYDFAMPDRALLPLAIATTYPQKPHPAEELTPEETLAARRRVAEFLAAYQIGLDHLYKGEPNELELLKELKARNLLGGICIRYIQAAPDEAEAKTRYLIDAIRPHYEALKEAGLLGHAYLYGFDELPESYFEVFEEVAAALHREFPELKIMTTAYDYSLGTASDLKSVDWWCPLTPKFRPELVDQARAAGDQVWWYTSCDPSAPFAGMQLEDQPLEARLLMGAMTARYRPDGFLFYETTYWGKNHEIGAGPYLDWNPHAFQDYNADGVWFYPAADGRFLPSLRLENFRAGLNDYTLFTLLRLMAERVERQPVSRAAHAEWLSRARAALRQVETLVPSLYEFNREPAVLEAWSRTLAELIEQSPLRIADLDDGSLDIWGCSVYRPEETE